MPGDMPMEQLEKYLGCSPRPEDFDAFWEKSLDEMKAVKPDIKIVPADFSTPYAECFDLYFTGVRGGRIHAKYLRPRNCPEPHPAVLQFHGYTWHSGEWTEKLGYAALGYSVFAMDCRGQGGYSDETGGVSGYTVHGHVIRGLNDSPDRLLFRQIFLDAAQMASIAMEMPEVDPGRVGAMGGSQGGALAVVCAALEPRIRKVASVAPFLSDYYGSWQKGGGTAGEIKNYFRLYDPQHKNEAEVFRKLGYIDIQNFADRVRGETVMVVGLSDECCLPSSVYAVYNKLKVKKKMFIYPDFAHENYPGINDEIFKFMMDL